MKVSDNFTMSEVIRSQTAVRCGIDNSLPSHLVDNAQLVAEKILEPVRKEFGIPFSPNSWYRCPTLNEAIGGSKSSDHMFARPVDIEIPGIPNLMLAKFIKENLEFHQLILEFYKDDVPNSGWVHCSFHEFHNAGQASRFDGKKYKHGLED